MNGNARKLIITKSIAWPNGLTLDPIQKRIFWVDAHFDYLATADYEGENRLILMSGATKIPHPFAVDVFNEFIFYTDWDSKGIHRLLKIGGKTQNHSDLIWKSVSAPPMAVKVLHPLKQPKLKGFDSNPCRVLNGFCMNLCLLDPIEKGQGYSCACAEGFELRGRHECVANCTTAQFICDRSYKCIPHWWR